MSGGVKPDGARSLPMTRALTLLVCIVGACRSPAEIPPELEVGTEVGLRAPALVGETFDGGTFALESGAPTVLVFYRSAQCGLCRVQLSEIERHLPAYQGRGVRAVAFTLDPADVSRRLLQDMTMSFPVVSVDTASFALWNAIDPETGAVMPVTYILDADGVVRYQHLGRNASDRALDAELLTVLETLGIGR
jgi:peroxiredoxin